MRQKREPKFFDCSNCKKVTLIAKGDDENTCPGCSSENGDVISSSELERRIEEGAVFDIDLSPGGRDKPRR
jgi:hypothetical protein